MNPAWRNLNPIAFREFKFECITIYEIEITLQQMDGTNTILELCNTKWCYSKTSFLEKKLTIQESEAGFKVMLDKKRDSSAGFNKRRERDSKKNGNAKFSGIVSWLRSEYGLLNNTRD